MENKTQIPVRQMPSTQIPATQIPVEYIPYNEIILCSNKLISVKKIVDDKGFIPILIGQDKKTKRPLIWLNAKTKEGVIQLIDKNRPLINVIGIGT